MAVTSWIHSLHAHLSCPSGSERACLQLGGLRWAGQTRLEVWLPVFLRVSATAAMYVRTKLGPSTCMPASGIAALALERGQVGSRVILETG